MRVAFNSMIGYWYGAITLVLLSLTSEVGEHFTVHPLLISSLRIYCKCPFPSPKKLRVSVNLGEITLACHAWSVKFQTGSLANPYNIHTTSHFHPFSRILQKVTFFTHSCFTFSYTIAYHTVPSSTHTVLSLARCKLNPPPSPP